VIEQILHHDQQRVQQAAAQDLYEAYLGRLPTDAEAAAAGALLRHDYKGQLQLIAQLVGSAEYFNNLSVS
jgi:hypothetical protein